MSKNFFYKLLGSTYLRNIFSKNIRFARNREIEVVHKIIAIKLDQHLETGDGCAPRVTVQQLLQFSSA